jgi:hypothetical protein
MAIREGRIVDIEADLRDVGKRLISIEAQLKSPVPLGERIAAIEGRFDEKARDKRPNPYFVTFLSLVGLGLLTYFYWLGSNVHDMGKRMTGIEQTLRLSQVSTDPKNPKNIKEAQVVLSTAQKKNIRIDPNVIKETGDKFIAAAATQPASWQVVQQYLGYRSFLNINLAPSLSKLEQVPYWQRLYAFDVRFEGEGNKTISIESDRTIVSPQDSARLDRLDEPRPIGKGPQTIVLRTDGIIILDNQLMKNVIVKDSHIEYHGGPTVLENVYFVNCVFDFEPGIKTQELGKAILASTAVTFKSAA